MVANWMTRQQRLMRLVAFFAILGLHVVPVAFAQNPAQRRYGLGDEAVPADQYQRSQLTYNALDAIGAQQWDLSTLPEFDARTRGWVTSPKDQGSCGSCWAFASAGTIESRILKDGGPQFDLAEQQQASCNTGMHGCCGGSGTSLMFYYSNQALLEADAPYAESGTNCPTEHTVNCSSLSGTTAPYLAAGFYTVEQNVEAFKLSLLNHGPSYFRFDVYSDFDTYWNSGAAGSVYKQAGGTRVGGHAILLIGWSESRHAFLLKNSWGSSGGPNHDGTFWLSYDGHANDLHIQMFNISGLTRISTPVPTARDRQSTQSTNPTEKSKPAVVLRTLNKSTERGPTPASERDKDSSSAVPSRSDGAFTAPEGFLKSLGIDASVQPERADLKTARDAGFSWYNNCRVNGNSNLLGTSGSTQISVFAQDVGWRYAFGGPLVSSPTGDGGSGGSGWRFPNAHRFGIVLYQGDRYWNIESNNPASPTVISGISNTEPVTVTVNDTNGNYGDNGGAVDIYVRKDN